LGNEYDAKIDTASDLTLISKSLCDLLRFKIKRKEKNFVGIGGTSKSLGEVKCNIELLNDKLKHSSIVTCSVFRYLPITQHIILGKDYLRKINGSLNLKTGKITIN
jgi:hypothetical protein